MSREARFYRPAGGEDREAALSDHSEIDREREKQRHAFERDLDRIIHTSALRRLAGVTQVAAPAEGYIVHNRLTHTQKVAQISRRLAQKLLREQEGVAIALGGLNPEVAEAAALAHDLGHPPFGHIAEEELDSLARDNGAPEGFEGNAQSFRIITYLAAHRMGLRGLSLTRATLNAVLKYPWLRDTSQHKPDRKRKKKFGAYSEDEEAFNSHARASTMKESTSSLSRQPSWTTPMLWRTAFMMLMTFIGQV